MKKPPIMNNTPPHADPAAVRRTILDLLYHGQASHLGTSMSMVEIMVAIFASIDCTKIRDRGADRSRVIVSKGHGACCTYSTMHHYGLIPEDDLRTYHQDGSRLAGHVSHAVGPIEHSTGALGHGLSVAVGCALGLRTRGYHDARVFVVLGDGEIQEGSIWEALMLARHCGLTNLVPIIDNNRISSITRTDQVINMHPLAERFAGFGFKVHDIDGHDVHALIEAFADLRDADRPGVVIANTVKGKGVAFAEDQPIWHYRTLNETTYREALAGLATETA